MSNNNGGPAFPIIIGAGRVRKDDGMSLRDYLAAKAMQGAIPTRPNGYEMDTAIMARWAYAMADAMLAEREKGNSK